jgi:hypothetical protein
MVDSLRASRFQRMKEIRSKQRSSGVASTGAAPLMSVTDLLAAPRRTDGGPSQSRIIGFDACSPFDAPWEPLEVRASLHQVKKSCACLPLLAHAQCTQHSPVRRPPLTNDGALRSCTNCTNNALVHVCALFSVDVADDSTPTYWAGMHVPVRILAHNGARGGGLSPAPH